MWTLFRFTVWTATSLFYVTDYIPCYKALLFTEQISWKPRQETPERTSLPHLSALDGLFWPLGWALYPQGSGDPLPTLGSHALSSPSLARQDLEVKIWAVLEPECPGSSSWPCHRRTTWPGSVSWHQGPGYTEPQSHRGYQDILSHWQSHDVTFDITSSETRTESLSILQICTWETHSKQGMVCGETWNSWFIHSEIFTKCSIWNSHWSINGDNLCSQGVYILLRR